MGLKGKYKCFNMNSLFLFTQFIFIRTYYNVIIFPIQWLRVIPCEPPDSPGVFDLVWNLRANIYSSIIIQLQVYNIKWICQSSSSMKVMFIGLLYILALHHPILPFHISEHKARDVSIDAYDILQFKDSPWTRLHRRWFPRKNT